MERTGRFGTGSVAGSVAAWVAALALLMLPAGSGGAPDPAARCAAAKHKALADFVVCQQRVTIRSILKNQTPASSDCQLKLVERWQAIEAKAKGACPVEFSDLGAAGGSAFDFLVEADVAIQPPAAIVVYDGGISATGGLDGIGGQRCEHAFDETFSCRAAPRLVAVGGDDLISPPGDFAIPFDTPVHSRSGVQIADSWEDFTDGDWDACLQQTPGPDCGVGAGVLPDDTLWWHGANFNGEGEVADNCLDFAVPAPFATGNVGISSGDGQGAHASPWGDVVATCDGSDLPQEPHVLCVCY